MSRKISDDETFITLMQLAREDPGVGELLKSVLAMDDMNRRSMLNTWINEIVLKKGPQEMVEALSYLLDDEVAKRALEVIGGSE